MQRTQPVGLTILAISIGLAGSGSGCEDSYCMLAGTPVRTPDGDRPIERIRVGDVVSTWSAAASKLVHRPVTAVHTGASDHYFEVHLDDGRRLSLTGEHPVFCAGSQTWKKASNLREGDALHGVDASGAAHPVRVRSVTRVACEAIPVFNLSVDTEETFLAHGVWVHNKSKYYDSGYYSAIDSGLDSGSLAVENAPPSVALDSPTSDAALQADTPIRVEARVDDPEDGPLGLSLTLTSSLDGRLTVDTEVLSEEGLWSGTVTLTEGTHTLELTATDTDGATALDAVTITVAPAEP